MMELIKMYMKLTIFLMKLIFHFCFAKVEV